jgi:hypothetical protein
VNEGGRTDWDTVTPVTLSSAAARQVIRELAADADNVIPVNHAKRRMRERKINMTQILRVARAGFIDGEPWMDEHHNWRVTMAGNAAGARITVGLAIEWRTRLLVVTVF